MNYWQQKQALDRLHAARNEDVSVMDLIVDEGGPQTKSVSVWPSGAEALLPKADVPALLEQVLDANAGRAVGTKRITTVPWKQATPLLSPLMEELPDLYPPRDRVRRFPDEATVAELQKADS